MFVKVKMSVYGILRYRKNVKHCSLLCDFYKSDLLYDVYMCKLFNNCELQHRFTTNDIIVERCSQCLNKY